MNRVLDPTVDTLQTSREPAEPIAVIGLGCRLPGGVEDAESFWQLLDRGVDAVTPVPADRFDIDHLYDPDFQATGRTHQRHGGFLQDIAGFDAELFNVSHREAAHVDPQQRLLLEAALQAMEHGGVPASVLSRSTTGVFVGISSHDYSDLHCLPTERANIGPHTAHSVASALAPNRISYVFNLTGPSLAIDTACSSTLSALHAAVASMRNGDCSYALVGGVNVLLRPELSIAFSTGGYLSATGRCQAFGAGADGFVRAEGVGMLLLQPLSHARRDRRRVLATILATSSNEDGRGESLGTPALAGQIALLRTAYARAGIRPRDVVYVEAHGTGTKRGDPVEAEALGTVLGEGRDPSQPLYIGSVKTNLGHLEAAAGAAGLLKLVLALQHRSLPKSLHSERLNPDIPFDRLKLEVVRERRAIETHAPRIIAGINSFGFGGANAHAVLEAAPALPRREPEPLRQPALLAISAKTEPALAALAERYVARLAEPSSLRDVAYASVHARDHYRQRAAIIARDEKTAVEALTALGERRAHPALHTGRAPAREPSPVTFVCSGQGSQWWAMGRELRAEDRLFRESIEEVAALIAKHASFDLLAALDMPEHESSIDRTELAQPAIFAVQIALARRWQSMGIQPAAVVGHSVGEVAAAVIAGALTLAEGAEVIVNRARLQQRADGAGSMLAVGVNEAGARALIRPYDGRVEVGAINGPAMVSLTGDTAPILELQADCERRGVFCRPVRVRVPFHSRYMDALEPELIRALGHITARAPALPLYSTVSGDRFREGDFSGAYWFRNVRAPVRFLDAVNAILRSGSTTFIELASHPILSGGIEDALREAKHEGIVVPSLRRGGGDSGVLLGSLARLYTSGYELAAPQAGEATSLPLYPHERTKRWVEREETERGRLGRRIHPFVLEHRPSATESDTHVFELDLNAGADRFLQDHRVQNKIVFPAAGHADVLLACARAAFGDRARISELTIHHPLVLPEPPDRAQVRVEVFGDTGTFRTVSRQGADGAWFRHVTGRFEHRGLPFAPRMIELAAVRARCRTPVDIKELYEAVAELGLDAGPGFQSLRSLHFTRTAEGLESIAQIEVPEALRSRAHLHAFHTSALDACLQACFGALPRVEGLKTLYLPVAIGELWTKTPPLPLNMEVVIRGRRVAGGRLRGDAWIFDGQGELIGELRELEAKPLDAGAESASAADLTSRFEPRDRPDQIPNRSARGRIAAPNEIKSALDAELRSLETSGEAAREREEAAAELHRICRVQVLRTMGELGAELSAGALLDPPRLAPDARRERLLRFWIEALAAAGEVEGGRLVRTPELDDPNAAIDRFLKRHPDHASEMRLIERVCRSLTDFMRGRADATEVLFGDWSRIEGFYRESYWMRVANALGAAAVGALAAGGDPLRTLRVLELGAGTGSFTAGVLPRLPSARTKYQFTDISSGFLARAKGGFSRYPFMEYGKLDLEVDPIAQGFARGGADLVLAANVLHATSDLRRTLAHARELLAEDGVLVLVEMTTVRFPVELMFSLTDGWWSFSDHDLRTRACVGEQTWSSLLESAGFADVVSTEAPESGHHVFVARNAARRTLPVEVVKPLRFAIAGSHKGVLQRELESAGHEVLDAHDPRADVVVDLGALDAPDNEALRGGSSPLISALFEPAVQRAQTLARHAASAPWLYLVTRGAFAAREGDPVRVACGALWGLGRVMMNENADVPTTLVDLPADPSAADFAALARECAARAADRDVILRGEHRFVPRIAPLANKAAVHFAGPEDQFGVRASAQGRIDTLVFEPAVRRGLGPGEVEIETRAVGLNFRDIMFALGLLKPEFIPELGPGELPQLGLELAGVVTRVGEGVTRFAPGDRVAAMALKCIARYVRTHEAGVMHIPARISFEEAATLPSCMVTVHVGLIRCARLSRGETVLIHSAAGGVGHAAMQVASLVGARVFATAGNESKRAYVRKLGAELVMDSRSLDFAAEILEATGGRGVDVVLNSLSGKAIERGLASLAPNGRFVELGKTDLYDDTRIGLSYFKRNISMFAVELLMLALERPHELAESTVAVERWLAEGKIAPLPSTVFPLSELREAFRWVARSSHVGKAVLSFEPGERVPLARVEQKESLFRADRSYLVTGGTSGLGLEIARWLAASGARHIMLLGRSGGSRPETRVLLDELTSAGVAVRAEACDVGDRARLEDVLREARASMPPIGGIFHGAMVLEDHLLSQLDAGAFARVLGAKADGALYLDALTRDDPIEHFVMMSSVSAILGLRGQASYNAANMLIGALAADRRARGLPGAVLDLGPVSDTGYVARNPNVLSGRAAEGWRTITSREVMRVLERLVRDRETHLIAMASDLPVLVRDSHAGTAQRLGSLPLEARAETAGASDLAERVLALEPEVRPAAIAEALTPAIAALLGSGENAIALDAPLNSLGLDSLMATQLRNRVKGELGLNVTMMEIMSGPTILELSASIASQLGAAPAPVSSAGTVVATGTRVAPLSSGQARFWFLHRVHPRPEAYNVVFVARLPRPMNPDRLARSLEHVAARHEQLRTRVIVDASGTPMQEISEHAAIELDRRDLSGLDESSFLAFARELASRPFDLATAPLWRASHVVLGADRHALIFVWHHLIIDGPSIELFLREVVANYDGTAPEPAPAPSYLAYVEQERAFLTSANARDEEAWWTHHLAELETLDLPCDRAAPSVPSHRGGAVLLEIPDSIDALAKNARVTPFVVLLSAWSILLHRYSGQDRFAVGTLASRRDRPELEHAFGFYANTLPLVCDLRGDPPAVEYLARLERSVREALQHGALPFSELVRVCAPSRTDVTTSPLFRTVLALDPVSLGDTGGAEIMKETLVEAAVFDLGVRVTRVAGAYLATIEYAADLFDRETVDRLAAGFRRVLEELARNSDRAISALPIISGEERARLTSAEPAAFVPHFADALFRAWAARTPDAPAIEDGRERLTYGELARRVNKLAGELAARGVGPDVRVGIDVGRGAKAVIAMLAVAEAGGAYVAFDPGDPRERARQIAEDAALAFMIAGELAIERLQGAELARRERTLTDLAYVIYTSGSTGRPKGVAVTHAGIEAPTSACAAIHGIGPGRRVLACSSLSFDVSMLEMWTALCSGACLVIAREEERTSPRALERLLAGVDAACLTPALLSALSPEAVPATGITVGGDVLAPELARTWAKGRTLINVYGPTETTMLTTQYRVRGDELGRVPIGRPIPGVPHYVLDARLEPVPIGAAGELYIGGPVVARGYLGAPDSASFVADPFSPGARMFKTGDRARRRADGTLDFLGRSDGRVKVRGFRVELAELESVLTSAPRVREAAAIVSRDRERIVAWIATEPRGADTAAIRAHLTRRLPWYMVPHAIIELDALPVTVSGKIDRRALESMADAGVKRNTQPAKNGKIATDPTEARLSELWREVLELEHVDRDDDFFAIGGHSLALLRLLDRIEAELGKRISHATFIGEPTIAGLVRALRGNGAREAPEVLVPLRTDGDRTPLFGVVAGHGDLVSFRDLTAALDRDQPFYALQPPDGDRDARDVEELVGRYADAIRSVQARGPYRLCGYSSGGLFAFELARRLEASGESVEFCGLLATYARLGRAERIFFEANRKIMRRALEWTGGGDSRLARVMHFVAKDRGLASHAQLLEHHEPLPYAGRVALFVPRISAQRIPLMQRRWRELARGGLDVHVVPGDHESCIRAPHVAELSRVLERCMRRS